MRICKAKLMIYKFLFCLYKYLYSKIHIYYFMYKLVFKCNKKVIDISNKGFNDKIR